MLVVCVYLSSLSLVAEWPLWFPSVVIVFDFFPAAVGFRPTVFLVGLFEYRTGRFGNSYGAVVYIEM